MPDCPKCGCNDVTILREPELGAAWWGGGQARCNFCGRKFSYNSTPATPAVSPAAAVGDRDCRPTPRPTPPPTVVASAEPPIAAAAAAPPPPADAVRYHVIHCPACGSDDTAVTRTARPIRYHKCRACGHSFKSVEG